MERISTLPNVLTDAQRHVESLLNVLGLLLLRAQDCSEMLQAGEGTK